MKKILVLLIITILLISCSQNKSKTYTLKYVVFYPNYNDTVTVSGFKRYHWGGDRGSNYIYSGSISIYDNSAPFKILSYTCKCN